MVLPQVGFQSAEKRRRARLPARSSKPPPNPISARRRSCNSSPTSSCRMRGRSRQACTSTDDQKAQGVDGLVAASAAGTCRRAIWPTRSRPSRAHWRSHPTMARSGSRRRAQPTAPSKNTDIAGQAALAALNGYQLTRTTQSRADALAVLGGRRCKTSENYRAGAQRLQSQPRARQRQDRWRPPISI